MIFKFVKCPKCKREREVTTDVKYPICSCCIEIMEEIESERDG